MFRLWNLWSLYSQFYLNLVSLLLFIKISFFHLYYFFTFFEIYFRNQNLIIIPFIAFFFTIIYDIIDVLLPIISFRNVVQAVFLKKLFFLLKINFFYILDRFDAPILKIIFLK
jgi:hypothetical protein